MPSGSSTAVNGLPGRLASVYSMSPLSILMWSISTRAMLSDGGCLSSLSLAISAAQLSLPPRRISTVARGRSSWMSRMRQAQRNSPVVSTLTYSRSKPASGAPLFSASLRPTTVASRVSGLNSTRSALSRLASLSSPIHGSSFCASGLTRKKPNTRYAPNRPAAIRNGRLKTNLAIRPNMRLPLFRALYPRTKGQGAKLFAPCGSIRLVHRLADHPEYLAERLRRLAARRLVARIADQLPQMRGVGVGELVEKQRQRLVVGDELLAPFLGLVQLGVLRRGDAIERVELRLDRRRVDRAHQLADVLPLAPQRAVLGDLAAGRHRLAQLVRQFDALELRVGQLDELRAEVLQRLDLALLLALAGAVVDVVGVEFQFGIGVNQAHGGSFGCCYYRHCSFCL